MILNEIVGFYPRKEVYLWVKEQWRHLGVLGGASPPPRNSSPPQRPPQAALGGGELGGKPWPLGDPHGLTPGQKLSEQIYVGR